MDIKTKNIVKKATIGLITGFLIVVGIYLAYAFTEPTSGPGGFNGANSATSTGNWTSYGRGWIPNASGSGSTALSKTTCDSAYGWYWFEDGNGDGDIIDEEDGICVKATSTETGTTHGVDSWNGNDCADQRDNTYIAAYTCAGNFPNGYVATYSGINVTTCDADTTYNDGDCALCQADCYDGKKDLPDQSGYTAGDDDISTGNHGPITSEVLKNWTGTRLPTSLDYFGFCGYKSGSKDYTTGCSAATTTGNYGHMIGRTDECIDASDYGTYEWLSERHYYGNARIAGSNACSYFYYNYVDGTFRFRAVFRP